MNFRRKSATKQASASQKDEQARKNMESIETITKSENRKNNQESGQDMSSRNSNARSSKSKKASASMKKGKN